MAAEANARLSTLPKVNYFSTLPKVNYFRLGLANLQLHRRGDNAPPEITASMRLLPVLP